MSPLLIQVVNVCSSGPPKVAAALSAAVDVRCSLDELLQREQRISNRLQQVELTETAIDIVLGQSVQRSDLNLRLSCEQFPLINAAFSPRNLTTVCPVGSMYFRSVFLLMIISAIGYLTINQLAG